MLPTLEIKNLSFRYKRNREPVVDRLDLSISPGGVYGLLGPNGAGKSTLLYLIAGLLTPTNGQVKFNGTDTRKRLPETLRDMFIVSEEFLLPDIPMAQYVKLNAPFYPKFSHELLQHNLAMFGLPADIRLGALSMGQKKKAFMSFALACNTSLLLMDEPTNGLDITGKSMFRRFIASAMTDDRTIIISTHQVRDIEQLLDHILIMSCHSLLFNRSVSEIQQRLQFATTTDKAKIDSALHSIPGVGGTSIILTNDNGNDTDINIEVLFDFAMHNPDPLNSFFNHK